MTSEGWGAPPVAEATAAPVETPEAFLARRNHEIECWLAGKTTLENAKEDERSWREKVVSTLFPNPHKGTQRYELSGGYKVKLVHGLTYSLGIKDMPNPDIEGAVIPINKQIEDLQQAIHETGNEGPVLAERLIKWKPELSATEYEKLNVEYPVEKQIKEMIDALLTVKPASPQLSFEEPKKK